jgi:hypothetical protein
MRIRRCWRLACREIRLLALLVQCAILIGCSQQVPSSSHTGSASPEWTTYTSPDGLFSLDFPGIPKSKEESKGKVTLKVVALKQSGGNEFSLQYSELPQPLEALRIPENAEKVLDANRNGILKSGLFTLSREDKIMLGRFRGRFLETAGARNTDLVARWKIYLIDQYLFQLVVSGDKTFSLSSDADRFFGSFRILKE